MQLTGHMGVCCWSLSWQKGPSKGRARQHTVPYTKKNTGPATHQLLACMFVHIHLIEMGCKLHNDSGFPEDHSRQEIHWSQAVTGPGACQLLNLSHILWASHCLLGHSCPYLLKTRSLLHAVQGASCSSWDDILAIQTNQKLMELLHRRRSALETVAHLKHNFFTS